MGYITIGGCIRRKRAALSLSALCTRRGANRRILPRSCRTRAENPFVGVTGGVPRLRTFATANCAVHQARGELRREHNSPLLAWGHQRVAVSTFSNPPRRKQFSTPSSAGRREAISTGGSPAKAAAGRSDAGDGVTFVTSDHAARRNADPGSVAFVTGANRGIGLEVTRQLLARARGEQAPVEWRRENPVTISPLYFSDTAVAFCMGCGLGAMYIVERRACSLLDMPVDTLIDLCSMLFSSVARDDGMHALFARPCAGTVVAACRDPSSAADLHALGATAGNEDRLDVVRMDIEDQASLEAAAEHVKSAHGVRCRRKQKLLQPHRIVVQLQEKRSADGVVSKHLPTTLEFGSGWFM